MAPGDRERIARIVRNIRHEEKRLRRKFAILQYQDFLGFAAVLVPAGGLVAVASLYVAGLLPGWAAVLICAFFFSILHEVEHDLIHDLYFRGNRRIQNLLFAIIWILRPNTISPWTRKPLHLLHHRVSGSAPDIEERLITNGMPYGLRRVLCLFDGVLNVTMRWREIARIPGMNRVNLRKGGRPMVHIFYVAAMLWGVAAALNVQGAWRDVLNGLVLLWVLPNVLRQFCLVFLSSSMHYYGGVDSVFKQTQVLNSWLFLPLQLFCFNFGATHGIHHFVVNQPFYLREMIRPRAHAVFRRTGLHFNDFGTFRRANRYEDVRAA